MICALRTSDREGRAYALLPLSGKSIDDSAGTAGSDAGLTSPDEALVGRAVLCTPNERCQGEGLFALGDGAHLFDSAQGRL